MRHLFIISLGIFIFSCSSERKVDLEGNWVSAHIRLDQDHYQPLLSHIHIYGDSAIVTPFMDPEPDSFPMHFEGESLRIDTMLYKPEEYGMKDELFWYRKPYKISMYPTKEVNLKASRIQIRNALRDKSWRFGDEIWHLKAEGMALIQSSKENPATKHCWSVKEVQGDIFLVLSGNQVDCDMLSHPIFQIVAFEEDQVTLQYAPEDKIETKSLTLTEAQEPGVSDFQLCNRHLNIGLPSHQYYYQGTSLIGGHYHIRKILDKGFDPEGTDFTGTVRVRFIVNCEGKTGQFETAVYNPSYERVQELELAEKLERLTRQLGPWIPGTYGGKGGAPIDTYCFIAYKIKDGEVVDILP